MLVLVVSVYLWYKVIEFCFMNNHRCAREMSILFIGGHADIQVHNDFILQLVALFLAGSYISIVNTRCKYMCVSL